MRHSQSTEERPVVVGGSEFSASVVRSTKCFSAVDSDSDSDDSDGPDSDNSYSFSSSSASEAADSELKFWCNNPSLC